jgi:uncharacterized protein YaeQ
MEFKIALSHVERGLEVAENVIVGRHPSESAEHVTLRVLAWCLLHEDGLQFGPGLSDAEGADLLVRDGTGRATTWVECGASSWEKIKRVLSQNGGVRVHGVFAGPRRRDELTAQIAALPRPPKDLQSVVLWTLDPALVTALAACEDRRQRWTVTVVEGHVYIDADGKSLDGTVESGGAS